MPPFAGVVCRRGAAVFSQLRPLPFYGCRSISQDINGPMFINTLAMVKRLERKGLPFEQAAVIVEVINDSMQNATQCFVSKEEIQMSEIIQEAKFSMFKSEMRSLQEHHFNLLQRETQKLGDHIDNTCSELRYKIDEAVAEQRHALKPKLDAADYCLISGVFSFCAVSLAVFYDMK